MKHLFLFMLAALTILASCSEEKNEEGNPFVPPTQEQLTQRAYADNESTGGGFSFTAAAPWTATVNDAQASVQAFALSKSAARTVGGEGNNVVWLKLYNGNSEAYSGGAGTITLHIKIDQNYTGERREAAITVRSGDNTFTVTVVQEGTKQDGSQNEAPVPVEAIALDMTALSLGAGETATLTATVTPNDATIRSVAWSSSNPAVATVHPVTGLITAVAGGKAVITATSSSDKEVSASCAITVGGDNPEPSGRQLVSEMKFYSKMNPSKSYSNIKLTYDDQNRLTKWEEKSSDEGDREDVTVTFEYGKGVVHVTSVSSSDNHPYTYTAYLNENGFVTRTEGPGLDATSYEYDSENHLVRTVQASEWEEYVWKDGNLVEIKYGSDEGESDVTRYTYYGELANKENFDIFYERMSWDIELAIAGLTGVLSRNLLHEERGESQWAYKDDFDMTYEVDGDGYITKTIETQPQHSASEEDGNPWIGEIKHIPAK